MLKLGGIIFSTIFLTSCASAIAKKSHIGADICKHAYFGGVQTDALIIIAPTLPVVAMAICHKDDKKEICKKDDSITEATKKPMLYYPIISLAWGVIAPLAVVDLPFSAIADFGEVLGDVDCKLKKKEEENFWRKDAERSARMNQEEKFRRDVKVQEELKKMRDEIQ